MPKMLRLIVIATLIAICSCADRQGESGAEEERVNLVPVQSIEAGKVQIVGRLGVPIGTNVTVSGKWHMKGGVPTKLESGIDFRITSINGKRLSDPVVFDKSEITEVLRRRFFAYSENSGGGSVAVIPKGFVSYTAYEHVSFMGIPAGLGDPVVAGYASPPARVYSYLMVVTNLAGEPGRRAEDDGGY